MNKFKLGDHVRILDPHHKGFDKAGIIVKLVAGGYLVQARHDRWLLFASDLTLADGEREL